MSRCRLLTATSTGLAHGAAAVVQLRQGVGELHDVLEVLQRGVAPAAVQVGHEGRAVVGGEDGGVGADLHAASGVTGVLDVDGGSVLLHDLPAEPAREAHELAGHVRAGPAPQLQRLGELLESDAHLGEQDLGALLDAHQPFFVEDLHRRCAALQVRSDDRGVLRLCRPPGGLARRLCVCEVRSSWFLPHCVSYLVARSPLSSPPAARTGPLGSGLRPRIKSGTGSPPE